MELCMVAGTLSTVLVSFAGTFGRPRDDGQVVARAEQQDPVAADRIRRARSVSGVATLRLVTSVGQSVTRSTRRDVRVRVRPRTARWRTRSHRDAQRTLRPCSRRPNQPMTERRPPDLSLPVDTIEPAWFSASPNCTRRSRANLGAWPHAPRAARQHGRRRRSGLTV